MENVLSEDVFMEGFFRSFLEYGDIRRGIVHAAGQYHAVRIAGFYTLRGMAVGVWSFSKTSRWNVIGKSCGLSGGSLVLMSNGGLYHLVAPGCRKVYLGCRDNERSLDRLVKIVTRIIGGALS